MVKYLQSKRISLFIVLSVITIVGVPVGFLYLAFEIPERNDDNLVGYTFQIGDQLEQYKKEHKYLPDTLAQAGIQEKVCVTFKCTIFHYKVSANKQMFTLAANASYGFVVIYDGTREYGYRGGMASENSSRADMKRYMRDKDIFATPSAWPVLEENTSLF